jgi:hypothetical protein
MTVFTVGPVTAATKSLELNRARVEKQRAEAALESRRSVLISRVQDAPDDSLPDRVLRARAAFRAALSAVRSAADAVAVLVAAAPPEGRAQSVELARLSAMVAAYVEGFTLVPSTDSRVFLWRVRRPDRSHVNVGPYASDRGIMFRALERLTPAQRRVLGAALLDLIGYGRETMTEAAVAEALIYATPAQLARAALVAVGVDPDSQPPTLAE